MKNFDSMHFACAIVTENNQVSMRALTYVILSHTNDISSAHGWVFVNDTALIKKKLSGTLFSKTVPLIV